MLQLKSNIRSSMLYRAFDLQGNYRHKKRIGKPTNMKATYNQQVRILSATSSHIKYSTHIDNFYYVRKAKINVNTKGIYFICIFGLLKQDLCQRQVYIRG